MDPKNCPHKNRKPLYRQRGADDPPTANSWIKRGEECMDCGAFIAIGESEASKKVN